MAACPNCAATIAWDARACGACQAAFEESSWQPIPESDAEKASVAVAPRVREEAQRAQTLRSGQLRICRGRRFTHGWANQS
jgi:hypothetical protein